MAVTFAINSVLDRLTKSTIATLTAQGEEPKSLPRCTTAEQAAFLASDLPATILEVGKFSISEENSNVGSLRFCQAATLHHVRPLVPGGSAVEEATARMAAVCTALYHDYRLESVSADGDQSVEMVRMTEILSGAENPVQQLLNINDEDGAVQVVSLRLELDWVEDDLPAGPSHLPPTFPLTFPPLIF